MKAERFSLRKLCVKDADRMLEWMHSDDITQYLKLDGKSSTKESVLNFILDAQNIDRNYHYAIVDQDDVYYGTVSLKNIDLAQGNAEYAIALHPSAIGQKVSEIATRLILELAFKQLQLKSVYLNVLDDNKRAINFYEKFGFQYEKETEIIFQGNRHCLKWYSIESTIDRNKIQAPQKLVFFFEKKQVIGGGLIFFTSLAKAIANTQKKYQVFYVNYPNEEIEKTYLNDTVTYCNIENCNFSMFEGAHFVVPLNYLFLLLEKIQNVEKGKLLLFDWHPNLMQYLYNQFFYFDRNHEPFLSMLKQKKALAFMDQSCAISVNRFSKKMVFQHPYVPVFLSQPLKDHAATPCVSDKRISIGWLGRLDGDKIYSVINLLDMLMISDLHQAIDLHIIGDGSARNQIQIHKYAPKIRFIFTSYLLGDTRDQYIIENIDLMIAMGISALDVSNLSIPTVIPIVSSTRFNNNQFVFLFDTIGYSLGWTREDLKKINCQTYPIQEIIRMVYSPNGKESIGLRCHHFCKNYFNLKNSAHQLLKAIDESDLSIDTCRKNIVVNRQLKLFYLYKKLRKSKHRTYSDYILFVQKVNKLTERSLLGKGKVLLKICFNPLKQFLHSVVEKIFSKKKRIQKRIENLRRYQKTQESYVSKIDSLKVYWQENKKLRAAFLVMFSSVFPCEPIFEIMLQDSIFDPYIIIIPDMQRSLTHKINLFQDTYEDLKSRYGDRVLKGFDIESDSYMELKNRYQLVFFNNPYSRMAHEYHHVTYFLDRNVLSLYVNYGFAAVKYGRVIIESDFYNLLWKVCLDSEINFKDVQKQQAIKGKNALVTGYVKMDRLSEAPVHLHARKLVIICPHHTVLGWKSLDISNFLSYYDFFIELPKLYPNIDFVFRPHPLLFPNLIENKIWSQQKVEDYLKKMEASPNIRYDNSGDYFELFANSDAMIHDCSSFIGEYLFTEKPCCYMLKSTQEIEDVLLPMGIACMEHYYKALCKEDILRFIDQVVVQGDDPLKEKREVFSRTQLKFNYPHSAQMVIDTIKRALDINEEKVEK